MKRFTVFLFSLLFLFSCSGDEIENSLPSSSEMLSICKNECGISKENYCLGEKIFLNNGTEITGTCRSFSKYNPGFPKCEGFCKQFGKNKIRCSNKDGTINLKCN